MEINEIINRLIASFSDEAIKKSVLKKEWYELNIKNGIDSTGFCYAASEIIYRLNGGKDVWKKVSISKAKWEHGSHYYLIHKQTGEILDITSDQFTSIGIEIPYELGVGGGFMGKGLSKASKKLAIMAGIITESK